MGNLFVVEAWLGVLDVGLVLLAVDATEAALLTDSILLGLEDEGGLGLGDVARWTGLGVRPFDKRELREVGLGSVVFLVLPVSKDERGDFLAVEATDGAKLALVLDVFNLLVPFLSPLDVASSGLKRLLFFSFFLGPKQTMMDDKSEKQVLERERKWLNEWITPISNLY